MSISIGWQPQMYLHVALCIIYTVLFWKRKTLSYLTITVAIVSSCDRLEWTGRGVLVIGVASGSSAVGAIAVVGDLLVLHEVDHPDRAIVSRVGGGELAPVFVIDRAVAGHGCSSTKVLAVRLPDPAKGSSISATSWSSPVAMR
ncbi:MAG: hypothetical protein EBY52_00060 [Actinobacteria bacterium]|nr:hypothetical protein [Actinomycetota bacterium]